MERLTGRLVKVEADLYHVDCGSDRCRCKARGLFRKLKIEPVAGDFVEFEPLGGGEGRILAVLPRVNLLLRPPAANIDRLLIVASLDNPPPSLFFIDKLTVAAESAGIPAALVLNKTDLSDGHELFSLYTRAGFKVYKTCAADGTGIEALRELLKDGLTVLCGFSGVGKSSLLNRLLPEGSLETGEVSARLKRGRHTTRRVTLLRLQCGGYVADTPGFSSLDIPRACRVKKHELAARFRDFRPHLGQCRYTGCAHIKEQGCAVLEALSEGLIAPSRHESYARLYEELKGIHDWE